MGALHQPNVINNKLIIIVDNRQNLLAEWQNYFNNHAACFVYYLKSLMQTDDIQAFALT